MKMPLGILAVVAIILMSFYLFAPRPGPEALQPRTDLPWQITLNPDGTSRVFDLNLGRATLADAIAKFGPVDGIAIFEPASGPLALEAFFDNARLGPLKAKVIVGLDADPQTLAALRDGSRGREGSPSGDWKYPLGTVPADHAGRTITVLTYIPGTRGLDQAFFLERFGKPAAWLRESEHAVSWFYPQLGLAILIDDEAREALEYVAPRDFVMPADVTPYTEAP